MAPARKSETAKGSAGLREYERKRDFGATAEPSGAAKPKPRRGRRGARRFVVQGTAPATPAGSPSTSSRRC